MVQAANTFSIQDKTVYLENATNNTLIDLGNIMDTSTVDTSKTGKIATKLMHPIAFLQPKRDANKSLLAKPKEFLAFNDEVGRAAAEKIIRKADLKGKKSLIAATIVAAIARVVLLVTSPLWILQFAAGYKIADLTSKKSNEKEDQTTIPIILDKEDQTTMSIVTDDD